MQEGGVLRQKDLESCAFDTGYRTGEKGLFTRTHEVSKEGGNFLRKILTIQAPKKVSGDDARKRTAAFASIEKRDKVAEKLAFRDQ